jgi:hypothetical protein
MTLLFNILPEAIRQTTQSLFYPIDILTVPLFAWVVIKYFNNYKDTKKSEPIYERFFMKALYIRLICTVLTALMYDFYYNGGDTTVYFYHILFLKPLLYENPALFLQVVFDPTGFESQKWLCGADYNCGLYLFDGTTGNIVRFGLLLSYFCFSSFWSFQQFLPYMHLWVVGIYTGSFRNYILNWRKKWLLLVCLYHPSVSGEPD